MSAGSIYGAMYALESFLQLVDMERGEFAAASVEVFDAPDYPWRGIMVDPGSRFIPVSLLENTIDTMAAVKMNVMHIHLTDFCRFGVESLVYPALTAGLASGQNEGFYTQDEIRALIAYAGDRGVRIVPEFELPGHALGLHPIASPGGLEFCDTCAYGTTGNGSGYTCMPSQLFGSEGTAAVLKAVLREMAALFTDEVLHIGCDETFVKPSPKERCNDNATNYLEKVIVDAVQNEFHKTPPGGSRCSSRHRPRRRRQSSMRTPKKSTRPASPRQGARSSSQTAPRSISRWRPRAAPTAGTRHGTT